MQAWGRILAGRQPNLSVEITRECPLRCPGCYAFGDAHLGADVTLRGLSDYRGDELVERFIGLVNSRNPLHVSIVGGEPLVRYRELNSILPTLAARNIHTQLVTSAVRPIPVEWAKLRRPGAVEFVQKRLSALSKSLGDKPYLDGDRFTAGDLMMTTVLRILKHTDIVTSDKRLAAYIERCTARPAFKRAFDAQIGDFRQAA